MEGANCKKSIPGQGDSKCKGPYGEASLHVYGTAKEASMPGTAAVKRRR